jgi:DNA-binding SARP family transcriptional activator
MAYEATVRRGRRAVSASRRKRGRARGAADAAAGGWARLFDDFPFGLVLVGRGGEILRLNERAADLLGVESDSARGSRCCDLICNRAGTQCLNRRAVSDHGLAPTEIHVELEASGGPSCAWAVASRLDGEESEVLFHLRPGATPARPDTGDEARVPGLRVRALGRLSLETESGPIAGEWLARRPGDLLKYLVCERSRTVASEQIAEALWPNAGQREALTSVRHYVHQLRAGLEPDRSPRAPSSYIATRRGGYALRILWIDADEFEHRVERGERALTSGDREWARAELDAACSLYRGDFLADDPYAEWALAERDRLRELASRALRALIAIDLEAGLLEVAGRHARELTELEPFDVDVHREFLRICLRLGRHGEAARRYELLRTRLRRSFGEDPGFTLPDLAPSRIAP